MCRTLVGYDRNGLGYKRKGRGNNVPCTMILPNIAMKFIKSRRKDLFDNIINGGADRIMDCTNATEIENDFMSFFESYLKLTEKALLERFQIMVKQSPAAGPFMYQNGTIADADKCVENVYNALKHNTLAMGYIGIAEMCEILYGANHANNKQAYDFALRVVTRINKYAAEASERNNLNFSCYATPAEGLCSTAMRALQKEYGSIPGIFDREYLTNSHHMPVWEKLSIIDKLTKEAPFSKLATGGCITYIEVDSTFISNIDAIEKIIDYAFQVLDIPYLAFNFPIDTCDKCYYTGEFYGECPECGSKEYTSLRRVTGYLTLDYRNFNVGKRAEVRDRYRHSEITNIDDINAICDEALAVATTPKE